MYELLHQIHGCDYAGIIRDHDLSSSCNDRSGNRVRDYGGADQGLVGLRALQPLGQRRLLVAR